MIRLTNGVKRLRHMFNEITMRHLSGLHHVCSGCFRVAVRDVFMNGTAEQYRILRNYTNTGPPRFRNKFLDILPIEEDFARSWVVEPEQEELY